jgi:hypothetical protein
MQVRRSRLEIPDKMMDQEPTRFLSEIEGGMPIGPKTGTGSSENPRYVVGSGSTEATAEGATPIERSVFWGPGGVGQLFRAIFRGSKNFLDGCTFLPDGCREEFVGSGC